jgi:hypothetical protein
MGLYLLASAGKAQIEVHAQIWKEEMLCRPVDL